MTTRLIIGYALLILLVAGCAFAIWWAIHNSDRSVRRRKRQARRESRKAGAAPAAAAGEEIDGAG
jgi:hypothetical protein